MHTGQTLGPYTLVRRLGEGGTSDVWLAEHRHLDCLRALKTPKPGIAVPRQRVLNEARVQAIVDHPNVASVHDVFEYQGRPVIVQEFVEGIELSDLLAFPMPAARLEGILRDILAGLAALHAEGVIHRDLKPSNVIVGSGGRARILDLGIARHDDLNSNTCTGALMGTPAYMAPEQADDATAVTLRSDLFAVGCIALTLLTGCNPFMRPSIRESLVAMHHCDELREQALQGIDARGANGRIITLIRQTLVHDPAARLPNAQVCMSLLQDPEYETLQTLVPEHLSDSGSSASTPSRRRAYTLSVLGALSGAAAAATVVIAIGIGSLSLNLIMEQTASADAAAHAPATIAPAIPQLVPTGDWKAVERVEVPVETAEKRRRGPRAWFSRRGR